MVRCCTPGNPKAQERVKKRLLSSGADSDRAITARRSLTVSIQLVVIGRGDWCLNLYAVEGFQRPRTLMGSTRSVDRIIAVLVRLR